MKTPKTKTSKKPAAAPKAVAPKKATPAKTAKRDIATAPVGEGYAETAVIRVVEPVAAREGSLRAARFGALRDGVTVGGYLDAALKASGGKRSRSRGMRDLRRLVEAGNLRVEG